MWALCVRGASGAAHAPHRYASMYDRHIARCSTWVTFRRAELDRETVVAFQGDLLRCGVSALRRTASR